MDQNLGAEPHMLDRRLLVVRQQDADAVLSEVHELSSCSWLQDKRFTIVVPVRSMRYSVR